MATIKNLAFIPKDKLRALASNSKINDCLRDFPAPLDTFHGILPLRFKFLNEFYAAVDDNKIYALISIEKDNNRTNSLNISKIYIDEAVLKYGELLINYVVSKFLSQGAESFFTVVDETDDKMLKLFSDVCKFRIQAAEYLYKIKKSDFPYQKDTSYEFIRFSKNYETSKIANLYNGQLKSHQLPVFGVADSCLKDPLFVGIYNNIAFRYVLENTAKNIIFGYFTISTKNNTDFLLDVVLLNSYEAFLADILKFTKSEISKRNTSWTLYLRLRDCFVNCKAMLDVMKNYDFTHYRKSKILVKDMFKTAKAGNSIYNKQIIFDAPAY